MRNLIGSLLILAAITAGAMYITTDVGDLPQLPSCDSYCRTQCAGQDRSCWNECRASGECNN